MSILADFAAVQLSVTAAASKPPSLLLLLLLLLNRGGIAIPKARRGLGGGEDREQG
ncbi:hypothetical protein [Sporisorium scitamineum]|uniref:Uncharacterized protein n=1 Tax=Sporisorium scitamineum TaxID=49012 RepID=A0A0F7S900_9BASI|nr:hypothetical protein [Sporisorium scitamineum]